MVNLLIVIHCHQPVGNFDQVFADAFKKSYLPFVEVLEKHPRIKLSLHYTGSLLDWLSGNRPEFIAKIRRMVGKGQVEIFAGGYYEPILTLIPEEDAWAQIELLKVKVKELFNFTARGAWIAERVWEPKLPQILAKAKMEYGVIDDSHFSYIGQDPETLNGFYVTEESGLKFKVFPGSEKLRYLWPFKLPQDTLDYLRNREKNAGGNVTVTFGDDGEKFGLWPGTHKWVYRENWLENFFRALEENSSWINLVTFKEYVAKNQPTDRVYLPCASYREMMEWSDGYYRNFMVKYPESNNMHKKMLYISNQISSLKSQIKPAQSKLLQEARRHLYMSQANDSYWHGVFGGLYLNHLRYAVYHHLIEAEKLIDRLAGDIKEAQVEETDFDCDGKEEILVNTRDYHLCLRPAAGASLSSLDYKPQAFNLINTLARRREHYHQKIKELAAKKKELKSLEAATEPTSIHDFIQVKEEGLENILFYDRFPRYCLLDHFLSKGASLADFVSGQYRECADFVGGRYAWKNGSGPKETRITFFRQSGVEESVVTITKSLAIKASGLDLSYVLENAPAKPELETVFGIEFNLSSFDSEYAKAGELKGINKFVLNDKWNFCQIEFMFSLKANLWYFPVETVSESEAGIEKSCQETCLFFWWNLKLAPKAKWQQNFKIGISA